MRLLLTPILFSAIVSAATFYVLPPTPAAAARFLRQASWGPTPASIAEVQQKGFDKWIQDQFAAPQLVFPDITDPTQNLASTQSYFFQQAIAGPDQLRQRVAFALSEIWVVSAVKLTPQAIPPYLNMLLKDSFGNYLTLMKDVTLSPAMGHYLDMVNNDKPDPKAGKGANENYAREVMQLFSIGTDELTIDGTPRMNAGQPIPTYTQDNIEGFANAFTGWTYAPVAGTVSHVHNPANWLAPMVAFDSNHDETAKLLLNGTTLPAKQTAQQDLDQALQNIFSHPNLAPFISKQLIQHLVTSNPSPGYVKRVAEVFNGPNRGDLKAVITAVLLDQEARRGDNDGTLTSSDGHLQEPALFITGLVRALNGTATATNSLEGQSSAMGQPLFYSPSVFKFFSPAYQPSSQSTLLGPEFELYSQASAMLRAEFVNSLVYGTVGGVTIDLTPLAQLASNPGALLDWLNTTMLDGHMSPAMRNTILTALQAIPTNQPTATQYKQRTQAAVYLIGSSSQYQVMR